MLGLEGDLDRLYELSVKPLSWARSFLVLLFAEVPSFLFKSVALLGVLVKVLAVGLFSGFFLAKLGFFLNGDELFFIINVIII